MQTEIIVALIGAAGSIAAGGWALYERMFTRGIRGVLGAERRAQLGRYIPLDRAAGGIRMDNGFWIGTTQVVRDTNEPHAYEARKYRARFRFKRSGRHQLTGDMDVLVLDSSGSEVTRGWQLQFVAGFVNERTLIIEYWSPENGTVQFGTIVLEYIDKSSFEGKFVARGRDLRRVIFGQASLERTRDERHGASA